MKLLIIEGTDCVGKSTIIQQLVKYYDEYNITIRHFGRPKGNNANLFQYNAFLNEVKIQEKNNPNLPLVIFSDLTVVDDKLNVIGKTPRINDAISDYYLTESGMFSKQGININKSYFTAYE